MFDVVRNNKRIVQVFLALIALPFAFFGVESYVRDSDTGSNVARIGDVKITQQQFQQAMREQLERIGARMGGKVDPKLFDTPEARQAILNDLIDQRLLLLEANNRRLVVPDAMLSQQIAGIEAFRVDGKFSRERYEAELARAGLSPLGFENQMRQDILLQQLAGSLNRSGFMGKTALDQLVGLQTQTRLVQEHRLAVDSFLDKVTLADDAVQKFYDANGKQFEIPEQARAEYLVLGKAEVQGLVSVAEAEIKAWYDSHQDRYSQPETRQASHILLTGDKARARGEELLKEINKSPKAFAELARKHSQDPGSAEKGGDLGYFGRGAMVKSFEEAVFAMKVGDVSGIVESDFGVHLIKLTGIRGGSVKPLAEVRGEIEAQLREAAIGRKFAEVAESFTNTVYEQSDSLKPAAEKYKLTIRQSDWIGRKGGATGPLANDKVLEALFGEESVKNRRNTEAIEIAPNTLVAARIVDYKPAARQPLDSVRGVILSLLKRQEAQKLATQEGEKLLAQLKAGEDKLGWSGQRTVSRLEPAQIPPSALAPVFKAGTTKLPAYVGVEQPGSGYALYRIAKVEAGPALDGAKRQAIVRQLSELAAQEEFQSYVAALRARYKVEINNSALEAKAGG